jgi:hypothetical protein
MRQRAVGDRRDADRNGRNGRSNRDGSPGPDDAVIERDVSKTNQA